jgi:N-acetylmuramoyl-L-alanine amidase
VNKTDRINMEINNDIMWIQKVLNRLKITDDKGKTLVENGINNENTKQAIRKFQWITNAEITGIVENNTRFRINEILDRPLISSKIQNHTFAIMFVQYIVDVNKNGIFDNETLESVKEWQKKNNLKPDGIIDLDDWNVLIGD